MIITRRKIIFQVIDVPFLFRLRERLRGIKLWFRWYITVNRQWSRGGREYFIYIFWWRNTIENQWFGRVVRSGNHLKNQIESTNFQQKLNFLWGINTPLMNTKTGWFFVLMVWKFFCMEEILLILVSYQQKSSGIYSTQVE